MSLAVLHYNCGVQVRKYLIPDSNDEIRQEQVLCCAVLQTNYNILLLYCVQMREMELMTTSGDPNMELSLKQSQAAQQLLLNPALAGLKLPGSGAAALLPASLLGYSHTLFPTHQPQVAHTNIAKC